MTTFDQYALRRGTAATWTSVNPILPAGVEGYETDTGKRKVGDGSTHWASLAYDGAYLGAVPAGLVGGGGYDQRLNVYNLGNGLKKTRARINGALPGNAQIFHVGVIGASISEGMESQPSTTAWPVQLRNLLNTWRGTSIGGTGWVTAASEASGTVDSRWSLAGGFTAHTAVTALGTGPGAYAYFQGGGNATTLVFTSDKAGRFPGIAYSDADGPFSWKVDAGGASTVTPGGTNVIKTFSLGTQPDTVHTITITQTSSTAPKIFAVAVNEGSGVQVTDLAVPGFSTADLADTSAWYSMASLAQALHAFTPFHLIIIGAEAVINDDDSHVLASSAASQANLTAACTFAQALSGDVLMVGPPPVSASWSNPVADMLARRQAIYAASDATGVPVLDLYDRWQGSTAYTTALALQNNPDPHLTALGNTDVAAAVAAIIAP